MREILKHPTGENPLIAAFRSQKTTGQRATTAADLQRKYADYFQAPPAQQPAQIQRFSLTDPSIQTIATSSSSPTSR
jgi:hypothetical protein